MSHLSPPTAASLSSSPTQRTINSLVHRYHHHSSYPPLFTAAFLSGGARPRQSKQPPAFLDLFGWCTWDAFYSAVDSDGIERGMSALEQAGVTPGFVIIDDGWQQVTGGGWGMGMGNGVMGADEMGLREQGSVDVSRGVWM